MVQVDFHCPVNCVRLATYMEIHIASTASMKGRLN